MSVSFLGAASEAVDRAPRKSNMSAEPPRSYPRASFVEVPAIVDSEVDSFEMKNPPKSRTGAPLNKCGKLTAAGESD